MLELLSEIRSCAICPLEHGHRPIVQASPISRILIIGQAPGRKVHETGVPWDDPSGRNLRKWLGVTDEQFYNPDLFALVPMGFCYPGHSTGPKPSDLPPRTECAPKWHDLLLAEMPSLKLTLLFGKYAQKRYLGDRMKPTLTETVKAYKEYLPNYLALPHPSPRNGIWMKKNPWFEEEVLSDLKRNVHSIVHP